MKREARERRIGLARAMSTLGHCSRSQAGEMIRAGRVLLNGKIRRDPETPVLLDHDRITLDCQALQAEEKVYLMLNKPRTVVTTASDEAGRETVYAYLPPGLPWVAPVGRLDKASEGLLLMTNDSEWAARITAPGSHVEKTYHVRVGGLVGEELLQKMIAGVKSNGEWLRVKRVAVLRSGSRNCWLEVVLDEGRNRQIRRILEVLRLEVLRLIRVAIGSVQLGELKKGTVRTLTAAEKNALDEGRKSEVRTKK